MLRLCDGQVTDVDGATVIVDDTITVWLPADVARGLRIGDHITVWRDSQRDIDMCRITPAEGDAYIAFCCGGDSIFDTCPPGASFCDALRDAGVAEDFISDL